MAESTNRLGEYLRARRELVGPEDVGLPAVGRRRVPGLRREELALLAGISSDYYLRLEQGRDRHPSEQVLDALARVLRLDDDATAHLHRLARPAPRHRPRRPERVPAGIQQLVLSWTRNPAFVQGRYMDILFANPLAIALSPLCRPGVNVVRALFLDPEIREAHGSETATAGVVAGLRALVGPDVDDPPLAELVGELSVRSERFRRLWARHDVKPKAGAGTSTFQHPQIGPIELSYEKLAVTGTEGQLLVVYHAAPGSPAEQALALLSGLAADAGQDPRSGPGAVGPQPSPDGWLRS
ncbi:helix-turn-helix transcriptional regulator [Streptomyces sp. NPDC094472]|uniref:helix-turn-helix transcriptional regulator n=1 Tax=Streptomyces sp. NPDC094472 TaxID=3155080 RepID=UPI003317CF43